MTTAAKLPDVLPETLSGQTGKALPRPVSRRLTGAGTVIRFLSRWSFFVENEIADLAGFIPPGAVCIDAGASYGSYSYPLALAAGATGSVHSVEPMPRSARLLRRFASALGGRNIRVHKAALGNEVGTATMSVPRRRFGLSVNTRSFLTTGAKDTGANAGFASHELVETAVTTIDSLCAQQGLERVDFIKADVEGNEIALLEGAKETLATHRPTVLLEIEQRHIEKYGFDAHDVANWLADFGYAMYVWRRRSWQRTDAITTDYRNYLFVNTATAD